MCRSWLLFLHRISMHYIISLSAPNGNKAICSSTYCKCILDPETVEKSWLLEFFSFLSSLRVWWITLYVCVVRKIREDVDMDVDGAGGGDETMRDEVCVFVFKWCDYSSMTSPALSTVYSGTRLLLRDWEKEWDECERARDGNERRT